MSDDHNPKTTRCPFCNGTGEVEDWSAHLDKMLHDLAAASPDDKLRELGDTWNPATLEDDLARLAAESEGTLDGLRALAEDDHVFELPAALDHEPPTNCSVRVACPEGALDPLGGVPPQERARTRAAALERDLEESATPQDAVLRAALREFLARR